MFTFIEKMLSFSSLKFINGLILNEYKCVLKAAFGASDKEVGYDKRKAI